MRVAPWTDRGLDTGDWQQTFEGIPGLSTSLSFELKALSINFAAEMMLRGN